jgi:hypothetical protein
MTEQLLTTPDCVQLLLTTPEYIESLTPEQFGGLLVSLNVEELDREDRAVILEYLVERLSDVPLLLRLVLVRWQDVATATNSPSVILSLFRTSASVAATCKALEVYPECSANGLVIELLSLSGTLSPQEFGTLTTRLNAHFKISRSSWSELTDILTEEEKTTPMGQYMLNRSSAAPKYISNFQSKLPNHYTMSVPRPNASAYLPGDIAVTRLISMLSDANIEMQCYNPQDGDDTIQSDCANRLLREYNISTLRESRLMLGIAILDDESDERDVEIFRALGPVNSSIALETGSSNVCCAYGCRMFTCVEYIDDSDTDQLVQQVDDWFTGRCDHCDRSIPALHHAVRLPLVDGGWYGCYCRFKCVTENNPASISFICAAIGRIKTQLKSYGIQDRTYDRVD